LTFEVCVHELLGDLAQNDEETEESGHESEHNPNDRSDGVVNGDDTDDDSAGEGNEEAETEPQPRERYSLDDEFENIEQFAYAAFAFGGCHGVALDS
jgi:U3 small nucleolar ribonucleoprotein component